jgi:hypothetical protein
MEDLLIAILQGIFEFFIEIFGYSGYSPIDWLFPHERPKSLIGKCITWFIVGCGLAGISMLFLKRTWISYPALRTLNLMAAPIASAFISQAIARHRNRNNPDIIPRNHFWQAFWFTLGIVTVRFAFAVRQH